MNIIIYGTKTEYVSLRADLENETVLQYRQIRYRHEEHYDDLLKALSEESYDMIFVLQNGAEGMEGVIASRNLCPNASVIWFSDDKGFGVQSYRLNCSFFAVKPVSVKILSLALEKGLHECYAVNGF